MPGYMLSEGFAMEGGSGARRIVHLETGKTVELSPDEVLAVNFFCSSNGKQEMKPKPPPDLEKAQAFIAELRRRGILVPRAPEAAALRSNGHLAGRPPMLLSTAVPTEPSGGEPPPTLEAPTPEPSGTGSFDTLGLEDVLPLFRPDIRLTRQADGALHDALDPVSGKRFQLYDFEVSVARMLRRPRRVGEVLDASARLGIPVTVPSLRKFMRELQRYGFLVAAPQPTGASRQDALAPQAQSAEAVTAPEPGTAAGADVELRRLSQREQLAPFQAHSPTGSFSSRAVSSMRQLFTAPRTRGALVARAAGLAGLMGFITVLSWPSTPPTDEAPALAAFVGEAAEPPAQGTAPSRAEVLSAGVDRIWRPSIAELKAPRNGVLVWTADTVGAVKLDQQVGTLRLDGAEDDEFVTTKARVDQLRRLKRRNKAQRRELAQAQRQLTSIQRRLYRGVPVVAPAAGVLNYAADSKTRVREGEVVARVIDPSAWHVLSAVPSAKVSIGASCVVARYGTGQNAPCRVVDIIVDKGTRRVVAEVLAHEAAWLPGAMPGTTRLTVVQE